MRTFAISVRTACTAVTVLTASSLAAQVPSFADVSGHGFGERVTQHHEMVGYLRALEEASPRVTVLSQGRSWEERELIVAVVTSPENHARLDGIRRTAQRLADPRATSPAEAGDLMESQPVIVWYGGSIHGIRAVGQ